MKSYKFLFSVLLFTGVSFVLAPAASAQDKQAEYQKQLEEYKRKKAEIEAKNAEKAKELERIKEENRKKKAYNDGNRALRVRKYRQAIVKYDEALSIDDCFAPALHGKGQAYYRMRKYRPAVEQFSKAVGCNPQDFKSYWWLGNTYQKLGKYDDAISAHNKAIEINPNYEKAYYSLGTIYLSKKKNFKKAEDAFRQATEVNPNYAKAFGALGDALDNQGKSSAAIEAYKKSAAIKKDARVLYRLAAVYNKLGKPGLALKAAQDALKVKANYAPALFEAGVAAKVMKNYTQAITYFEKAAKDRTWRKNANWEIEDIKLKMKSE